MTQALAATDPKYRMTISLLTVDKLGVKLYDKVSAVLAELVANSYDADATEVIITAPMGELLATKQGDRLIDKGYDITVEDNGSGMTPGQINDFYLKVGAERRNDPRRGGVSARFQRRVMGRKGVGKLAPFGICEKIEVLTSGGERLTRVDTAGNEIIGYETAHLVLDRGKILTEVDYQYPPEIGQLDGTLQPATGTKLTLTGFSHRHVPNMDDLERQLAQRFGVSSSDWKIVLKDSTKTETDPQHSRQVGAFQIAKMDGTELRFYPKEVDGQGNEVFPVRDVSGNVVSGMSAGFEYDGRFYPVTGWAAYAREPYKDDLMAGVRIYCRGKIAAQTAIFNRKAGFTGEYDVRSYLVGELHADWLDEEEDLLTAALGAKHKARVVIDRKA